MVVKSVFARDQYGILDKEEAEDTVDAEYVDLTNKDKLSMMAEQAVEEAKPAKTKKPTTKLRKVICYE